MSPKFRWICPAITIAVSLLLVPGCATLTAITHYNRSTRAFRPLDTDHRVLYEPGAKQFALAVAKALPHSIETVQSELFGSFSKRIRIYVCQSPQSFTNMTGRQVKAITYRESVFLSPRLMENQKDIPSYLTHELTHLFLWQPMGLYKVLTIPPWFNEGLAVCVSNGGGAGDVTKRQAAHSLLSGKAFYPNSTGTAFNFFFPEYGSHWNLRPHMFYRQASLFVSSMKQYNHRAFKNMLLGMQHGQGFDVAFRGAYNTPLSGIWQLFIKRLQSQT